jgi:hypothetical protein
MRADSPLQGTNAKTFADSCGRFSLPGGGFRPPAAVAPSVAPITVTEPPRLSRRPPQEPDGTASLPPHEGRTVGTVAQRCAFAWRLVNEANGSGAPCPYCVCPLARRTVVLSGNFPNDPRLSERVRAASKGAVPSKSPGLGGPCPRIGVMLSTLTGTRAALAAAGPMRS